MRIGRIQPPRAAQAGFGYVWVMLAVAAFGTGLAAVGQLWSTQAQREREAELLLVGREYRQAFASYYAHTRPGTPAYPARLEELLEDRRGPILRRHLRKLYLDPITGSENWGLVSAPGGRIRGVYSRSERGPIKTANFASGESRFEKAKSYADWRFEHFSAAAVGSPRR